MWRSASRHFASSSAGSRPRSLASVSASRNCAASCVVNAFVDATPISVPARVRNTSSVCRTIELVRDVADRERVRVAERLARASAPRACRRSRPIATRRRPAPSRAARCRDSGIRWRSRPCTASARASRSTAWRRGSSSSSCRTRGSAPNRRLRQDRRRPSAPNSDGDDRS